MQVSIFTEVWAVGSHFSWTCSTLRSANTTWSRKGGGCTSTQQCLRCNLYYQALCFECGDTCEAAALVPVTEVSAAAYTPMAYIVFAAHCNHRQAIAAHCCRQKGAYHLDSYLSRCPAAPNYPEQCSHCTCTHMPCTQSHSVQLHTRLHKLEQERREQSAQKMELYTQQVALEQLRAENKDKAKLAQRLAELEVTIHAACIISTRHVSWQHVSMRL